MKCSFVVPLVNPNTAPLALLSQYGVPNPTKAGTIYTPSVDATLFAYVSLSGAFGNILSPSRNHCMAEPAIKILPSNEYSTFPSNPHANVVNNPWSDATPFSPVFINMKQPVP